MSLHQTDCHLDGKQVTVHFRYYWPKAYVLWQHKRYGSIDIIEVMDSDERIDVESLPVESQIACRHAAWEHLHGNQLLKDANVSSIWQADEHHSALRLNTD
ncbi:hypothetical protein Lqui_2138 [Legionella quinlivanii]|uniref:Uncharacterized protein n=2 Tax=Legionella TaxID=445 RepID=A0A0W0XTB5_9GAMM|nr:MULTISPECIES: hypothetical protein [Legionella]KTC69828.1 hypothetical protein Lbir_1968 [Legionella birminghamensis]KTD48065.1 hypothetical protein Lqui_2138 [Legionella quinlivanii]MCE3043669.1 hypothetical protein [Legionella sp. 16cNR16C]SEG48153.1 hypothetical protein SAMN02746093_03105 [Legionella quinlivanii DSM 21216]STX61024.1 Uncharacterised protein [Legionella birminghamensis]